MEMAQAVTTLARKVLVIDDHPIVRQGLRRLIEQERDLLVCGEAETIKEARDALVDLEPDVVVMDISLKEGNGMSLLKDIRARNKTVPVLVLSMHDETIYAERMLSAGANGYIMKQAAGDQFISALRRVLDGGIYVSESMGAIMIEKFATGGSRVPTDPIQRLSNRELQVLQMIGDGRTTRQAAEVLNLSVKTVESHRQRIKRKLNLKSAAQLVQYAVNWNVGRNS